MMPEITRRRFIRNGALGAAAVGTAAAAPNIIGAATAGATTKPRGTLAAAATAHGSKTDPVTAGVVAHVVDPASGHIALYVGTRQIDIRDRAMARALTAAAGK